jgi:hypothetical protein
MFAILRIVRDMGCQAACHSDSVQKLWKQLLLTTEEQHRLLLKQEKATFLQVEPDSNNEYYKFVPENKMNPERIFLQELRTNGILDINDDDDDEDNDDDEFTYPSLEGFFGQNTDFLYYSKHVKLSYSPFIAHCVQSLDNWDTFFSTLFLDGTIPEALSLLNINDNNKKYLYVRSPIQLLDDGTYRYRDDGEHYITYPFFPFLFHLYAKNSSPPRTWSSNLFSKISTNEDGRQIAEAAKDWTLDKIRRVCQDPKGADDRDCGGEWFEAYLHSHYREIYDDIDLSDTTELLKKNKMTSLTSNYKYNIGKIKIPNCQQGMEQILQSFDGEEQRISPQSEVFAKILIDIYMSCLLDFSTIVKIGEIMHCYQTESSSSNNKVIVLYMGTAHIKAVSDFFVHNGGFKKKCFIGKYDYNEKESRRLELPSYLWDFSELFPQGKQ